MPSHSIPLLKKAEAVPRNDPLLMNKHKSPRKDSFYDHIILQTLEEIHQFEKNRKETPSSIRHLTSESIASDECWDSLVLPEIK